MKHPLDPRKSRFQRDPEAAEELKALRQEWLERTLRLAGLFRRMHQNGAHFGENCGTIRQLARRFGYDEAQSLDLAWLGYALERCEGIEEALRANTLRMVCAYEIGKIYRWRELVQEDDAWIAWANTSRLTDFRRRVRKRLEAMRQNVKRTTTVTLELGHPAKADFDACRRIASQKARKSLSNSQAAWAMARFYREAMDPREQKEGTRRMGPTIDMPSKRGIPAAVIRKIWARSGGLCEFGGCDRPGAEYCHVKAHRGWRKGNPSGRETGDLVHGCHFHHSLYDAGRITLMAWSQDGRPVFQLTHTNEMLAPKPWPEDREKAASPEWLLRAVGKWDTKEARAARKKVKEAEEKKQEEEGRVQKKAFLDDSAPSSPPVPPGAGGDEKKSSSEPISPPDEETPPPKPESPDGSGLVHDRGPPFGEGSASPPAHSERTPRVATPRVAKTRVRVPIPRALLLVARMALLYRRSWRRDPARLP